MMLRGANADAVTDRFTVAVAVTPPLVAVTVYAVTGDACVGVPESVRATGSNVSPVGRSTGLIDSVGAVAKPVEVNTIGVIAVFSGATSVVAAGVTAAGGTLIDTVDAAVIDPLVAVIW
jgi:hypothetical protein